LGNEKDEGMDLKTVFHGFYAKKPDIKTICYHDLKPRKVNLMIILSPISRPEFIKRDETQTTIE